MHIKIEGRRTLTPNEEKSFIGQNIWPCRARLMLYLGLLNDNCFLADYLQAASATINKSQFIVSREILERCRDDFELIISSPSGALIDQFLSEASVPDWYLDKALDDCSFLITELTRAVELLNRCLALPHKWGYEITVVS